MKRNTLLRHLRRYGCVLKRAGRSHSVWGNPATGQTETIPRHTEIRPVICQYMARRICRRLSVPEIGRSRR